MVAKNEWSKMLGENHHTRSNVDGNRHHKKTQKYNLRDSASLPCFHAYTQKASTIIFTISNNNKAITALFRNYN